MLIKIFVACNAQQLESDMNLFIQQNDVVIEYIESTRTFWSFVVIMQYRKRIKGWETKKTVELT